MEKTKPHIKKSISDPQLKDELIKLFESGRTAKVNSYELLRTRFKIGKQRCLQAYDMALTEWQITKQKAQEEQIHSNAVDSLKRAYMSKQERLEFLDNIAKGNIKIKQPFVIGGKIMEYPSEPTAAERLKAIAEMNKMEGDYAPQKTELTGANGKDLIPDRPIIVVSTQHGDIR